MSVTPSAAVPALETLARGGAGDDRRSFLRFAVEEARRLLRADGAVLYLYDEATDTLSFGDMVGVDDARAINLVRHFRIRPGASMLGTVAAERQTRLTGEFEHDRTFVHSAAGDEVAAAVGMRSAVIAPIAIGDRLYGTLSVFCSRANVFDDADAAVVRALAGHAAAQIANLELIGQLSARERELHGSRERYRTLVQQSPDGVWALDDGGRFDFWSQRSAELLGRPAATVLGAPFEEILTAESHEDWRAGWARIATHPGEIVRLKLVCAGPRSDRVPSEVSAVGQFLDGAFIGAHGLIRDLREQLRLEDDLRQRAAELAASEERANLAQELHDSVSQALFSMNLIARTIELSLDRNPDDVRRQLATLRDLQRDALTEMRSLVFELRPARLDEDGLGEALRLHARTIQDRLGLPISLHTALEPDPGEQTAGIDLAVEEALYRIAQEALHNVVRHAAAQSVRVALELDGDRVRLSVEDDGVGFDPARIGEGHLGVAGMRDRARRVGGELTIVSGPGEGTRVEALVPARITGRAETPLRR